MRAFGSKCEERPPQCKGKCLGTRQLVSMRWNGNESNNVILDGHSERSTERVGEKQREMARPIPSKRRRGFAMERKGFVKQDSVNGRSV